MESEHRIGRRGKRKRTEMPYLKKLSDKHRSLCLPSEDFCRFKTSSIPSEFQDSLGYRRKPCLKHKNKQTNTTTRSTITPA